MGWSEVGRTDLTYKYLDQQVGQVGWTYQHVDWVINPKNEFAGLRDNCFLTVSFDLKSSLNYCHKRQYNDSTHGNILNLPTQIQLLLIMPFLVGWIADLPDLPDLPKKRSVDNGPV